MTGWHWGARWGQARITWSSSPPGCGGSESSGGVGKGGACGEKNGNRVIGVGICCAVFSTAVPIIKLFAWGGGDSVYVPDSGGHVLRETTSLCELVCPSRTGEIKLF